MMPAIATMLTRAIAAVGHSCWGILNGPATGKAMAELITTGKATCVDLAAFDPARFSRTRGESSAEGKGLGLSSLAVSQ